MHSKRAGDGNGVESLESGGPMLGAMSAATFDTGMATVLSGPHEGDTHAFLATPVDERIDKSIADVAPTHPKSNFPANVRKQLLQRFARGRFEQ
jgi:hypothetical protein